MILIHSGIRWLMLKDLINGTIVIIIIFLEEKEVIVYQEVKRLIEHFHSKILLIEMDVKKKNNLVFGALKQKKK
jgi:hypothetical protein